MVLPSSWKLMLPTTVFRQRRVNFRGVQHVAGLQIFHAAARDGQVDVFVHAQLNAVGIAEPDRLGGELFTDLQRRHGFEEAEAPCQQFLALGFAAFVGAAAHHGGDQTHLAFGRRSHVL